MCFPLGCLCVSGNTGRNRTKPGDKSIGRLRGENACRMTLGGVERKHNSVFATMSHNLNRNHTKSNEPGKRSPGPRWGETVCRAKPNELGRNQLEHKTFGGGSIVAHVFCNQYRTHRGELGAHRVKHRCGVNSKAVVCGPTNDLAQHRFSARVCR